ncbi:hypothetical protein AAG570_012794 [Ranatra chinensis]|uniref:Aldehyde dehydrogenase domain-containing protein n=1 Tax=Ranatra chinensis TaxID=642074 RepID=A0ABD0YF14_9HEMI
MSVLREEAFIDGAWVTALRGGSFKVYNPTDGSCVGEVPSMDIDDARNAVTCAHTAFNTWSQSTAKERSDFLKSWFNEIKKNTDELARILSLESGKPLAEATGEIAYGNSFIEWYSEEARRCYGEVLCSPFKNKQLFHIKQPIGVAALITPWNFPMAMIARKAGAALAAGCTCVVKPAEDTPLSSLVLAYCAEQAGLPNGVFNVVPVERSNAATVGKYLCESPLVAGVTFTGSTTVGKLLYEQCAKGVKRISLELGGNAPFIVFRTSDIEKAVDGAIAGKFRNCGQTCVSPNRFLIEDKIFDEFVAKLTDRIKEKLELGNPIILPQNKQRLGPLINLSQLEKVDCFVKDAVAKGAVIHCGGKLASYLTGGLFYEPTLLSNITPNMMCYSEEIFGPVVSCVK